MGQQHFLHGPGTLPLAAFLTGLGAGRSRKAAIKQNATPGKALPSMKQLLLSCCSLLTGRPWARQSVVPEAGSPDAGRAQSSPSPLTQI